MRTILSLFLLFVFFACQSDSTTEIQNSLAPTAAELEADCRTALLAHLEAVSIQNLEALSKTLSPTGQMQLSLTASPITYSAQEFLDYHEAWFAIDGWTFETEILNLEVGSKLGIATVEALYQEEERDGVPYFNRLAVSYVLRLEDGQWYVIKDMACSLEKSTD